MTQTRKQQAIFPDLPRSALVDKNGNMNDDWRLYFQHLTMALQTNFKPEGIVVPPKPTTEINDLTADESDHNIIYDNTTDEFKGNINGTWKVFTLV